MFNFYNVDKYRKNKLVHAVPWSVSGLSVCGSTIAVVCPVRRILLASSCTITRPSIIYQPKIYPRNLWWPAPAQTMSSPSSAILTTSDLPSPSTTGTQRPSPSTFHGVTKHDTFSFIWIHIDETRTFKMWFVLWFLIKLQQNLHGRLVPVLGIHHEGTTGRAWTVWFIVTHLWGNCEEKSMGYHSIQSFSQPIR